jgi:carbamoyl-phosphate synthase small subunit
LKALEAVLALEDGTVYRGHGFGAETETTGEVVFNTGMTGYTESLTDASYAGQILLQTYPLIGNYGVPAGVVDRYGFPVGMESDRVQVQGYIVSKVSATPSHWASKMTLHDWLQREVVPGIYGLDTRRITEKLRTRGVMLGILKVGEEVDERELAARTCDIPDPNLTDLVAGVSAKSLRIYGAIGPRVVLIDCGVKLGIIRNLLARGAEVVQLPHDATADQVMSYEPDGVVVSNGPGDPDVCHDAIKTLEALMEYKIPIMGICLGQQLMALAAGATKYKLKYGHRGQNHPCTCLASGRSYVTSQNHGFGINVDSLQGTGFEPYFVNVNDGTLEGIKHSSKPFFAVQFHPEGATGPLEAGFLFDEFMRWVR